MSKINIIKRLKWYYPTERLNAITFLGILLFIAYKYPVKDSFLLLYGLFLMVFILFQGTHYWKLKLNRLLKLNIEQEIELHRFRKLFKANVALIAFMPAAFLLHVLISDESTRWGALFWWGLAANLFGFLEHINYYHVQLMIDNKNDVAYLCRNKKLKVASLRKDLDENQI